jgi:hypothetical protein
MYTVGECISQLKWNWFYDSNGRKKKQLSDIQSFDTASRGPLGSVVVLLKHKRQSLVSLGAIIIVFALVFDPFMQQVITYRIRERVVETADSSNKAIATQVEDMFTYILGLDTQSLVFAGAWSDHSELPQIRTTCPSGNCTWEVFHSLEMCSHCEDIDIGAASFVVTECDPVLFNMTIAGFHAVTCYIDFQTGHSTKMRLYFPFDHIVAGETETETSGGLSSLLPKSHQTAQQ